MAIKKITLAPFTPQQVHENQVSLQKIYDMHAGKRKNLKEKGVGLAEKDQEKKGNIHSAIELKQERKTNMLARVKDVRKALYSNQILLVLVSKETLLTNEFDVSLPSVVTNFLQEVSRCVS